jgi:hypothetical protein
LKDTSGKYADPSQEFFFISKQYGIDSRHRIYLTERAPRITALQEKLLVYR